MTRSVLVFFVASIALQFGFAFHGSELRAQPYWAADFNGDGRVDGDDIDELTMVVSGLWAPPDPLLYDIEVDGHVDMYDVCKCLAYLGAYFDDHGGQRWAGPCPFLPGDADLNEEVEGDGEPGQGNDSETDFDIWLRFAFQETGRWTQGDFNADGVTDGLDYIIWNEFKGRHRKDGGEPAGCDWWY